MSRGNCLKDRAFSMKLSSTSMEPDALKIVTADLERVLYRITPAELRRLDELERLALLTDLPKVPDQELAWPLATFY
jgi:hypothetical protein